MHFPQLQAGHPTQAVQDDLAHMSTGPLGSFYLTATLHHEIPKYCQSTARAHAGEFQNLIVPCCCRQHAWLSCDGLARRLGLPGPSGLTVPIKLQYFGSLVNGSEGVSLFPSMPSARTKPDAAPAQQFILKHETMSQPLATQQA